jgi:hypothetical protein
MTRDITFVGVLPIRWSEMVAYLSLYPIDDIDTFVHHIRRMDFAFIEMMQDKDGEQTTDN